MKTIKFNPLWLLLIGFLIGILLALTTLRPVDTSELILQIKDLKEFISKEQLKSDQLQKESKLFADSILELKEKYANLLSKRIPDKKIDSLQRKEIEKGVKRYGPPKAAQSQVALATVYGNQALDELPIMDARIYANDRVVGIQKGIVFAQDSIITSQLEFIKAQNKKTTQKSMRGFLWGVGTGSYLTLFILLLI